MRNTPANDYAVKRRFSGDAGTMHIPIHTLANKPMLMRTDQTQAAKVNPEYIGGQGSARKMSSTQPLKGEQEQQIEPIAFKLQ
jgi:hypothetical protein